MSISGLAGVEEPRRYPSGPTVPVSADSGNTDEAPCLAGPSSSVVDRARKRRERQGHRPVRYANGSIDGAGGDRHDQPHHPRHRRAHVFITFTGSNDDFVNLTWFQFQR